MTSLEVAIYQDIQPFDLLVASHKFYLPNGYCILLPIALVSI